MFLLHLLLWLHTLFQHVHRHKFICNHWWSYIYENVWIVVCIFIISKQLGSLNIVSLHSHHSMISILIWAKSDKVQMVRSFVLLKWEWIFINKSNNLNKSVRALGLNIVGSFLFAHRLWINKKENLEYVSSKGLWWTGSSVMVGILSFSFKNCQRRFPLQKFNNQKLLT